MGEGIYLETGPINKGAGALHKQQSTAESSEAIVTYLGERGGEGKDLPSGRRRSPSP
jgi:hypothetical protein